MRIYAKQDEFAKARILQGYSQRELARRSGLSPAYISLIERSVKSVGPYSVKVLSELLERDAEQIFRFDEKKRT